MNWQINLVQETDDIPDTGIYTIEVAGQGIWTLITHADGIELLVTPRGGIIRLDERDWDRPSTDPIAGILDWVQRYF